MQLTIELWTDGACAGNPGPGGWAYVLVARSSDGRIIKKLEGAGGEKDTTNNRMELKAAIEGLKALRGPTTLTVHPDARYLTDAFVKGWIDKWQINGWKSGSKPVKNQDLWLELLDCAGSHVITWSRVKGHSTYALNNRCDELAVQQRDIYAGR